MQQSSQTNIKTALWALSTIIFLIVVIVEVVMNFAPIKNEAQEGETLMNKNVIIDITSYIRHLTKKVIKVSLAMILVVEMLSGSITGVWKGFNSTKAEAADNDTITLRICNWEEYIDEGGWNADETIDLESGDIRGDNSMVDDFAEWYYKTYGKKVNVEYSCLGTNEELYNMLTLGDEYDLICPSEYMFMKLMTEGWLEHFLMNSTTQESKRIIMQKVFHHL